MLLPIKMSNQMFTLVVAVTKNLGIGKSGTLPCHLPEDLAHFKRVTTSGAENTVIMGRLTWESIPEKFRPLPGRLNIVISSTLHSDSSFKVAGCLSEALSLARGRIHIIGGARLFSEALSPDFISQCECIYLTRINKSIECDVYFESEFPDLFSGPLHPRFHYSYISKTYSRDEIAYDFCVLTQSSQKMVLDYPLHEEYQYLDLIKEIISTRSPRNERTKIGTKSVFGRSMRFDLSRAFPLLTTKSVFWRGVVEELLWFISGSTNAKDLSAKGVKIWDGNASREFLDSTGLRDREEGDLGPVYGFQWRHFGAEYVDVNADYEGQGYDQLKAVIEMIKNDPHSRRMVISAWNPADLHKMALPPCHVLSQFYVDNGQLSCLMYQRSCDMGLGVPFNIASYSLLCCIIAQVCGLERGEFIHVMGDTHVFVTHEHALLEQVERNPRPFPLLELNPQIEDIDQFTLQDIKLAGYSNSGKISMELAL